MSAKHTPGPWLLSGGEHGEWQIRAMDANGKDGWGVGMTFGAAGFHELEGEVESEANAHLMVAAPDMLAALRQMVVNSENDGHSYRDCHRSALEAIAKAEGRS